MRLNFDVGGIFRIADFGCGTGQNTLVVAHTIISAVQCLLLGEQEMPEFEVYFTDLPCNDFNSLFRMLPPPRESCIDADKNRVATRSYLAAAVCGPHFTRLFSRKSLHFCHSSLSLHWLSQSDEVLSELKVEVINAVTTEVILQKKDLAILDSSRVRNLFEVMRNIGDQFIRAYDSGKEVARMLEANKVHYHLSVKLD